MRTLLFLLWSLTAAIDLSAQDSTTVAAYLPSGSVPIEKQHPDNPSTRFQTAFYGWIRYPSTARDAGVTGAVLVTYTIDTLGQLTVTETQFLDLQNSQDPPPGVDEDSVLYITAVRMTGPGRPLRPTTNRKRLLRGQVALQEEVARTLRRFPLFEPARRDGQKVPDTQSKLVYFRME